MLWIFTLSRSQSSLFVSAEVLAEAAELSGHVRVCVKQTLKAVISTSGTEHSTGAPRTW